MNPAGNTVKILFAEDLPADAELALREIKKGGIDFIYKVVETEPDFKKELNEFNPDIVVSDYSMPTFDGMLALTITRKLSPVLPFIILTGSMNEETAVACMKAGANDYVIKEQITRLPFAVKEALAKSQAKLEKDRMQKQLHENEIMYRSLIENSSDAIYLLYEGKFEIINSEFLNMFGYSFEELNQPGFDSLDLVAPESKAFIEERRRRVLQGEKVGNRYEFTAILKNGEKREVEASVSYINFKGGIATQGIIRDITDRKKAVEKLRYHSSLSQILMELSYNFINLPLREINDAIYSSLTRMGKFVGADRSYIFEYDFENKVTSNTYEWCRNGVVPQIDNLQNIPLELVPGWVKQHRNGEIIFIYSVADLEDQAMREMLEPQHIKSVLSIPLMKDKNECIGFVGFDFVNQHYEFSSSEEQLLKVFAQMLLNVNQRKKLETNRTKLTKAVEQNPTSIIITNKDGIIEYVNPKTLEIFGYELDELIGEHVKIFKSGNHDTHFYTKLWNTILSGKDWNSEMINKKKNGEKNWVDVSISPIFNEGEITHFMSVSEDITKKKKMIEDLVLSKEKAEESDRLKSAFLANMSHEIRTPMNGIMGFTELLKEPKLAGKEKNQYIKIIQKSGQRMLSTINDLIEISKIESGSLELKLSEVNVNEQLDYLYNFFKPETENKGLSFKLHKPLSDEQSNLETDKEKLSGVLMNLIKNAIKYTDQGEIEMGCRLVDHTLEFSVKDTGIGIEEKHLKIIFDRFAQADISLSKPYEGAGLGLSIAKGYAEMLGGKIWLQSELQKGTQFFFSIPLVQKTTKKSQAAPTKNIEKGDDMLKYLTILVADDDSTGQVYISALLKGKCKKVIFAENGQEAVQLFGENPEIDLVLMDIKMPVMDGYEATAKIKEINPKMVVVALTAYALTGDKEKVLAAGCDDYLSKPFPGKQLFELVRKYFG